MNRRVIVGSATAALVVAALTACSPEAAPARGVELVVGAHANQPSAEVPEEVGAAMIAAIKGDAPIGVIIADGSPSVAHGSSAFTIDRRNTETQTASETAAVAALKPMLYASPEHAGSDLLSALVLAAGDARSAHDVRDVHVLDDGLSDTGVLDFSDPHLLTTATKKVVQQLLDSHEIEPDTFRGLAVHFWGLSQIADPQPALSGQQRAAVKALWTAVVKGGGGEADVRDTSLTAWPAAVRREHPRTMPVKVVQPVAARLTLVENQEQAFGEASALAFDPGLATLKHGNEAKVLAKDVAAQLLANAALRITVEGRTSGEGPWSQAKNTELSQQRADAVARLLEDAGVAADRITTKGVGYVAKPDEDAGGHFSEMRAARNRVVVLTITR